MRPRRRYLGSISVDVDIDDVLEQVSEEDLEEYMGAKSWHFSRDYAERALQELLSGRIGAGIALLDRALYPVNATLKDYTALLPLRAQRSPNAVSEGVNNDS